MKRKSILLICLLLIACLTFAACNNNKNNGDKKTWPSVSYLTDAEKYTGAGEITHVNSWDDGSNSIYINNATETSVSAYRTQMENAGWTLAVGPVNETGNTSWGYTKGETTCSIRLYSSVQTEERSSGNYSFNLYIGFDNDGVILPPSEIALSTPVVTINGSGLASWSAVTNASGYKYKISGGAEQATANTSVQLIIGQSIQVKAVGDGTNHTDSAYSAAQTYTAGGGNPTGISVSDFDYQIGSHYYISSRWDVTSYDNNDQEYVYQEYRKIALIGGVYFIETYDFNYQKSNAQGNYRQTFYIPDGSNYSEYYRNVANEAFESGGSKTSAQLDTALSLALGEACVTRAKHTVIADTLQNVTAGATSTHATGRTVKKYTYSTAGTTIYDFYIDTQTKACLKFDDYALDGHINLSVFSTNGNAWGQNGLPTRPDGVTPEPTALSVPVVTINNSGLASWVAIPNANSYKIKINGGAEEFAVGMSEQLSDGDTIQVKAIGDGDAYSDSAWSAIQTYTAQGEPQPTTLATPIVTINETGLATWAAVANASSYKYKINNGTEHTAPANRQVQLTDGQSISVKAVGNGSTYSDSVYSTSETYTEATITHTWPVSTKLAEYGFGGFTQPTGSTITFVGETVASGNEPATLTIVISNGTGAMFDSVTTSIFTIGATNGINDGDGNVFVASNKSELISSFTNGSSFTGMKTSAITNVYDGVMIEYYASAGTDTDGNPIAAQTFIITFAKIDLSSSSPSTPAYEDYIMIPNKFTITYGDNGETKTLIKDGDKLYWKVVSEYEDRERLAIKQSDGTYKIYEKDNKQGEGTWDKDYVPEYDNIYFALEAMDSTFFGYAQRMLSDEKPTSTGSGTVAGMTCNVYHFADEVYTYSYYCYSGLVFKIEEHNNGQTVTFVITSYSATGDLSGPNYSID